jgi:hypothetical protein
MLMKSGYSVGHQQMDEQRMSSFVKNAATATCKHHRYSYVHMYMYIHLGLSLEPQKTPSDF